ncbi:replication fork protection component Swi3-domain-containing protein [Microdochium trichocladiopsis]|uniref:Chromosome segregation in meiosis protein n=1 Tax=Microdochium trichocladiopsis TaxID=1682393 RepID=A0A9P8XU93_9PEZI|nr:replication fork protection component Swi3-domain-containing protein [Microdochium trichocladiopsis]KAH7018232.1 replication fork protection component Swi3-domain-containing protein [Microdochium trichocladiopsis]
MSSAMSGRKSSPPTANLDIDDYDVDDDPFASEPEDKQKPASSKKRKDVTGLGIDEEVAVAKKARVPNVKLDETRLLSEKGIPRLRRKAGELKFKGKGHEFSDAARLLSFYQLWLDDLFPKARFLDALGMVEKAGHKKFMHMKRVEWINEGKPQSSRPEEDDVFGGGGEEQRDAAVFPAKVAPIFQNQASGRPKTPTPADVPDDEDDLYGATPKATNSVRPTGNSLFGNGGDDAPDDDDLDALMAEEEAQRTGSVSLFGNGGNVSSRPAQKLAPDEDDDLDALMAEYEAGPSLPVRQAPRDKVQSVDEAEDDLDALIAESEARAAPSANQAKTSPASSSLEKEADADEEAAMAEMDGLW